MKYFPSILLIGVAALILSCGDSGSSGPEPTPDPIPGWLKVRFNSPNADDGGVMFTVAGGQIDSVRSAYSDLFVSTGSASPKRIVVAGNLISGIVAEIQVPDVGSVAQYNATVEQVAARGTFQQRAVSVFSLVVER